MSTNNLRQARKDLKAFAKRAKNVKYKESLLFSYLITGMITFSIGLNTSSDMLYERMNKELVMSAERTRVAIKKRKKANEETVEDLNLELIQLMEQGDQAIKSNWSSWQFGINAFTSSSNGTFRGRGDKAAKYPYNGIFTRGNWSENSTLLSSRRNASSVLGTPEFYSSTLGSRNFGLASLLHVQEPEVEIQIMANVRPKSVLKEEITINPQIDMPREVVRPAITLNVTSPISAPTIVLPTLSPVNITTPSPQEPGTPAIVNAPNIEMKLEAPTISISITPPSPSLTITPPRPTVNTLIIGAPDEVSVSAISVTQPKSVTAPTINPSKVDAVDLALGTAQLSNMYHYGDNKTYGANDRTITVTTSRGYVSTWGNVSGIDTINTNVIVNIEDTRAFMADEGIDSTNNARQKFISHGDITLNKSKNVGIDVQGTHTAYDGVGFGVNKANSYKSITKVASIGIVNRGTITGNGATDGSINSQVAFGFNNFDNSTNNTYNEMVNEGTITLGAPKSAGIQLRPENLSHGSWHITRGLNMMSGINTENGIINLNSYGSFGITTVPNGLSGTKNYNNYNLTTTQYGQIASNSNSDVESRVENSGTINITGDNSVGIGLLHNIQGAYQKGIINIGNDNTSFVQNINENNSGSQSNLIENAVGVYSQIYTRPIDNGNTDDHGTVNSKGEMVGSKGIEVSGTINIKQNARSSYGARIKETGAVIIKNGGKIKLESGSSGNYGILVEGDEYNRTYRTGSGSSTINHTDTDKSFGRVDIESGGIVEVLGEISYGFVQLQGAGSNAGNITVEANNSLGFYGNKGLFENTGNITTTGTESHAVVLQNTGSGTAPSATQTLTFNNTGNITVNTAGTVGIYAQSGSQFSHSGTGNKITAGNGAVGIYTIGSGTKGTIASEIAVNGSTTNNTGIGVYSDGNSETTFNAGSKLTLGEGTVGLYSNDNTKFESTFKINALEAGIGKRSVLAYFGNTGSANITSATLNNLTISGMGENSAVFYGATGSTVNIDGDITTSTKFSNIDDSAQFLVSDGGNANINAGKAVTSNLKTTISGLNGATVTNKGILALTGKDGAVGIYSNASTVTNENKITATNDSSIAIYGIKNSQTNVSSTLKNSGEITTSGAASVGIFSVGSTVENQSGGKIITEGTGSAGIYGTNNATITNKGIVTAKETGSAGVYADNSNVTNIAGAEILIEKGSSAGIYAVSGNTNSILNQGAINVGAAGSTETKGVGIYAQLTGLGALNVTNEEDIRVNMANSIGIYAENIGNGGNSALPVINEKNITSAAVDDVIGIMAEEAKVINKATLGQIQLAGKSSVGIYGISGSDVENSGQILLQSTDSTSKSVGILVDNSTAVNKNQITMSGGASAGMLGLAGATITNETTGKITTTGTASAGMYFENAIASNAGIINIEGEKSAGIFAKISDSQNRDIVNTGTINLSAGTPAPTGSVGMYANITSGAGGTTTLDNKSQITVGQESSVGMFIKNETTDNTKGVAINNASAGIIDLEVDKTVGIFVENATGINRNVINVKKENSAGMYGSSNSKITNEKTIDVLHENSAGMYASDSNATNTSSGTITLTGSTGATSGSAGMYGKLTTSATEDYTILNKGTITLTDVVKNVGIYGEAVSGVTKALTLQNDNEINIAAGSPQSVGIFASNDVSNDAGKIGAINSTAGEITVNSEESIGISAVKSTVDNSGTITMNAKKSAGIYGKSGSEVTNNKTIDIKEESSAGIYLEDSNADNNGANAEINVTKKASAGIFGKYTSAATADNTIKNSGTITLFDTSGAEKSAGIYGELDKNASHKLTIDNEGVINVDMEESVGIFAKNDASNTKDKLIANNGKDINVNALKAVGMLADKAEANNNSNITVKSKESTGMYGTNGSQVTNTSGGTITIEAITGDLDSNSTGIYVTGKDTNSNVTTGINEGTIKVDGIKGTGMLATAGAEIKNNELIQGNGKLVLGMYGTDDDTKVINADRINLTGESGTGIFSKDGAEAENRGTITMTSTSKNSVGMFGSSSGSGKKIMMTNTGIIDIESEKSTGMFTNNLGNLSDSVVKNTGTINQKASGTVGIYTPKSDIQSVGKINLSNTADSSVAVYLSNTAKADTSTGEIDLNSTSQNQVAYYVKGTGSADTGALYGGNIGKVKGYGVGVYLDGGVLDGTTSTLDYTANGESGNGIIGLLMKGASADISAYTGGIKVGNSVLGGSTDFYAIGIYADEQGTAGTPKTISSAITTGANGVGLFAENSSHIKYTGTMNIGDGTTAGTGIYIGNGENGTKGSTVTIDSGADIKLNGKNGVGAIATTGSTVNFETGAKIEFGGDGVGIFGQKGATINDNGGTLITNGHSVERTRVTEGSSVTSSDLTIALGNALDTGNILSHVINGEAILQTGVTVEAKAATRNIIGLMADGNSNPALTWVGTAGYDAENRGKLDLSNAQNSTAMYLDSARGLNSKDILVGNKSTGIYGTYNTATPKYSGAPAGFENKGTVTTAAGSKITIGDESSAIYTIGFDKVENNGEIAGKDKSVGIYAKNTASSSKLINITNTGNITLEKGSAGIFVSPETSTLANATVVNSGNITVGDSTLNAGGNVESTSVGIYVRNKSNLTTTGDITVGNKGFALYGNDSTLTVNGGNYNFANNGSLAYLENNAVLNYNNAGTLTTSSEPMLYIVDSKAQMGGNDIVVSANGTGIYMTGTSTFGGWNNMTLNNRSTGIYVDNSNATIDGKKMTGISDRAKGIVSINSNVVNKSDMEFSSDDSIGIFSQNKSGALRTVVNSGNIDITGKRSIAAYLEGTSEQSFVNSGTINVDRTSTSVKNDSTVGIYAQGGSKINITNTGAINVGESSFGIYSLSENGDVTASGSSVINVADKAIGIYKKGGTATLGGIINVADHTATEINSEPVGVYASSGAVITDNTANFNIGDKSYGVILSNPGIGGTNIYSNTASSNVTLGREATFIYTEGSAQVTNNATVVSGTNGGIIAIYGKDGANIVNNGTIDLAQGIGNQGILVTGAGSNALNNGIIRVGKTDKSDPDNIIYGIGMAAINGSSITNRGDIYVSGNLSIGMYGDGNGTTLRNEKNIYLDASGATSSDKVQTMMGVFANNGARFVNTGNITTAGSYHGNSNVQGLVGVAVLNGSTLENYGKINIDADSSYGVLIKGTESNKSIIKNYGEINISGLGSYGVRYDVNSKGESGADLPSGTNATPANVLPAINGNTGSISSANGAEDYYAPKDPSKSVGGVGIVQLPNGKLAIQRNGVILDDSEAEIINYTTPSVNYAFSNFGVYVDTLGRTRPINVNGATSLGINSDLIIGTEFSELTNKKNVIIGQQVLQPFLNQINSGIFNFTPYSASLTWLATPEVDPSTQQITRVMMTKIPYTAFVERTSNEYNFTDGLEQRYSANALDSREKLVFNKLNSIGNNEEALLAQAYDEMMGHQYANIQQRIFATGNMLSKEFGYLRDEWNTKSKNSNKIKAFGMRDEYKTDTAGIIDYRSKGYGVAYLHEDETPRLGESTGWYAGAVHNRFEFKDIGHSKENQTMIKAGIFKSTPFGKDVHNNGLNWTISTEGFVGTGEMHRKFLVVDEIFNAKSDFYSYGMAIKNELRQNIRTSERTSISPYGSLKLEYGRFNSIKEKDGEVRLEIKGNDYYSIKPELGIEFKFNQPFAKRSNFVAKLGLAYENELGQVADVDNKGRVAYTTADWFNIRGEKDNRRGNGKADLNIGIESMRFGVTVNAGYDTSGKNVRGGIGFRAIY